MVLCRFSDLCQLILTGFGLLLVHLQLPGQSPDLSHDLLTLAYFSSLLVAGVTQT